MKCLPFLLLFLVGCGTIKQTTTTTTEQQAIPKETVHDTAFVYIPYETLVYQGIDIDSAQRAYFVEHCKGTATINEGNLRATISYLSKDNKDKAEVITSLEYEIEKKEQIIQEKKTVTESKSTPGQLWIFFHSWQFTIPTALLFLVIGILLHAKSETIKRII